jgi:threonine dehydrogenase-like Zn-dependent dehydrogenase
MAEAVTLANNFVTVFHTLTTDLGIQTPWPKPEGYTPQDSQDAILIWGGASSVGQYAIQILRYYGYTNIFTTSSLNHHDKLRSMGAKWTLDYKDPDIVARILDAGESQNITRGKPVIPYVLDCIGSKTRSIKPISEIAMKGNKVAVLLPVIVRESAEGVDPEYAMDVEKEADWNKGVAVSGVRTHSYLDVSFGSRRTSVSSVLI